MAGQASDFLNEPKDAFQIWKTLFEAFRTSEVNEDAILKMLQDGDVRKNITQILLGRLPVVRGRVRAGWLTLESDGVVTSFKNLDGMYYGLCQLVESVSDRKVPMGTQGYIVGLNNPEEEERFVAVLFFGSDEVCQVSPGEIKMV